MKFVQKDGVLMHVRENPVLETIKHIHPKPIIKTLIIIGGIAYVIYTLITGDTTALTINFYDILEKLHVGNYFTVPFNAVGESVPL